MMFGVNRLSGERRLTGFVINRYFHLAYTVGQPSMGESGLMR